MSRTWEGDDKTFKYVRGSDVGNDTCFLELLEVSTRRSAWKTEFVGPLSAGRVVLCHPSHKPFLLISLTKGPHLTQGVVCDPSEKGTFYSIAASRLTLAPSSSASWSIDLRKKVHQRCCFHFHGFLFALDDDAIREFMQDPKLEACKISFRR